MTIHSSHPFPSAPDPVRRFRGRLGGAVSLWTSTGPSGLTVSSLMVSLGPVGRVLGLLDPDSDLCASLADSGRAVVQLLAWGDRSLAEAFAGTAPAPGGAFAAARWVDTPHGPRLDSATTWALVSLESLVEVGWSSLATCTIDAVEAGEEGSGDEAPLLHRRGRYQR
ncbi:MAG TPA: flavin reductase [Marmoricola sp.]|nr:flavin reductase [Marmoricola sp.]